MEYSFYQTLEEFLEVYDSFVPEVGQTLIIPCEKNGLPFLDHSSSFYNDATSIIEWLECQITKVENDKFTVFVRGCHYLFCIGKTQKEKLIKEATWYVFPRLQESTTSKKKEEILYTKEISYYASQTLPEEVIKAANEEASSFIRRNLREWPCDYDLAMKTKVEYGDTENKMSIFWYWKLKKEFHPKVI